MTTKKLKVGVVGATGMVGKVFMQILAERRFPIAELRPFASEASVGKSISLMGQDWPVRTLENNCFEGLDLVFFSSGDDISKEWAPKAVQSGAFAVDNSAAFRMDPQTILVVPEVNGHLLSKSMKPQVIANPNCSTIQLVVALKPLYDQFGIEEVTVSSYQAVSGAGQAAYDELLEQVKLYPNHSQKAVNFVHPMPFNLIPQIGSFSENGFCSEELKIMKETKKIMGDSSIRVSAMTVRVPVLNSHSESVWVTLKRPTDRVQIQQTLSRGEGLVVVDDINKSEYPMPKDISGKDPVYVGRIHQDLENPQKWIMWVVSDNIRKGAALNGIQIAERIFDIH